MECDILFAVVLGGSFNTATVCFKVEKSVSSFIRNYIVKYSLLAAGLSKWIISVFVV